MDTFENSLPAGTVLDNRYKIESVLGEGGFGITYKAHDSQLDYTVVIKEFLPQECAARSGDSVTVQPRTNRTDDYQYGLERFLDEARNLARFQHANIVRVSNFINTNGTVYFVMDYAEGEDLSDWLKKHDTLNEDIILKIVTPILEGLAEVHKTGLLHRDIKPGNIFMRKQGGPMLIDFGAARQALGEHSKSISAIISQGYAPPEQYTTRGKQGSFTDLYAIGAVLYKLVTGKAPLESADRAHDIHEGEPDPMTPALEAGQGKVGDWLLQLTDQMLRISAKDRPQNAEAVLTAIKNKTTADVAADSSAQPSSKQNDNKTRVVKSGERFGKTRPAHQTQSEQSANGAHGVPYGKIAAIMVVVVAIAGGGWWFSQNMMHATNESVQMNSDLQAQQSKTLAKGNAILYVDSQPSEAEIYLDGILLGQTPYKSETLPKGEHEIKLTHANAEDSKETITLKDNVIVKKAYKLDPASGTVSVFSTPEGASINLDGKDTGFTTPATLESVATGDHQIILRKDAYYPKEITINVLKGKAIREDLVLEGGHLVEYKGEWLEPEEKEKRIVEAKPIAKQQPIERLVGKMITIPAGSFQMGSNENNAETPVHHVSLKAFKLGQYEVTQKQWQAVMGSKLSHFKNCDNCPVKVVSWDDIHIFLKKLNQQTGLHFRLPSEAEWEYACRSGGKEQKYCGGNNESSLAWYDSNSNSKTHPVGQKQANGLGLYDMSGNVYEWTQDCWNGSYNGAPANGEAWKSGDCKQHVLRGGSWLLGPSDVRSSSRDKLAADYGYSDSGFRLAQDID